MAAHQASSASLHSIHSTHRYPAPITPIHSPHQSQSSTSSRTPLHTLTLHDYRKLQNTPPPRSTTPAKALKRKPAATSLNSLERIPSVNRSRAPTPVLSSASPLVYSTSNPLFRPFQALPPSPPDIHAPPTQRDPLLPTARLEDQFDAFLEHPTTVPTSVSSGSQHLPSTHKVSTFKPIKRLPKPFPSSALSFHPGRLPESPALDLSFVSGRSVLKHSKSARPLRPSAVEELGVVDLGSSTENTSTSDAVPTVSTFSLSRFPKPPQLVDISSTHPPDENVTPRIDFSFTTVAPETPPATPAVLHYRGTSFDLVNPHDSLLLHDIETPGGDFETESVEYYFEPRGSEDLLMERDNARAGARFQDLSSAYQSITGRRYDQNQSNVNLTSSPASTANPGNTADALPSPISVKTYTVEPLNVNKAQKESGLRRMASALKSSLKGKRSESIPVEDTVASTLNHEIQSLPALTSSEHGRGEEPRASLSEPDVALPEYYHNRASTYAPSSIYTAANRQSGVPSVFTDRNSVPFGVFSGETDYSNEVGELAAAYQYGPSPRESARASRPALSQEFLRHPDMPADSNTDTLSRLIDDYGQETSQPSLFNTVDDDYEETDDEDNLYHVEEEISRVVGSPERPYPIMRDSQLDIAQVSSGISELNFGFERGEISQASLPSEQASSPRSTHRRPTITHTTVGHAPAQPLPMPPPFEYEQKQPRRQNVGAGVSSEMFSQTSSYGDTRNLLQLSQPAIMSDSPSRVGSATDSSADTHPAGSGQILNTSSSYSQGDTARILEPSSPYSQDGHPRALEPSSSYSQDGAPLVSIQEHEDQENATGLSVPRRQDKNGVPLMWGRNSSVHLMARQVEVKDPSERGSPGKDSLTSPADRAGDDEAEWEDVEDPSRGNSQNVMGRSSVEESLADNSSDGSVEDPPESPVGHKSWELPLNSAGDPALRNPFNFSGGSGHNGASTPRLSTTPYRHPSPLASHSNPFRSSPPPLSIDSHHSRSVAGSLTPTRAELPRRVPEPIAEVSYRQLSDKEMREFLASGPNDDILYDTDEAEELPRTSNETGWTDYTEGSNSVRGQAEPPTMSTLAERPNSFHQLTILGPRANLTGTPLGTNMQEVGSSLADSSSPGARFTSPPRRPSGFYNSDVVHSADSSQSVRSPILSNRGSAVGTDTPRSSRRMSEKRADKEEMLRSLQETGFMSPGSSKTSPRNSHGSSRTSAKGKEPVYDRNDIVLGNLARNGHVGIRSPPNGRSSVRGQTKLRDMILPSETGSVSSQHTRISHFMPSSDRASSSHTATPLRPIPRAPIPVRASLPVGNSPHLLRPERPTEPVVLLRQSRISWTMFAVFCFCPPLLLLLGVGCLDGAVIAYTRGDSDGVAGQVKVAAVALGTVEVVVITLVVVLFGLHGASVF